MTPNGLLRSDSGSTFGVKPPTPAETTDVAPFGMCSVDMLFTALHSPSMKDVLSRARSQLLRPVSDPIPMLEARMAQQSGRSKSNASDSALVRRNGQPKALVADWASTVSQQQFIRKEPKISEKTPEQRVSLIRVYVIGHGHDGNSLSMQVESRRSITTTISMRIIRTRRHRLSPLGRRPRYLTSRPIPIGTCLYLNENSRP